MELIKTVNADKIDIVNSINSRNNLKHYKNKNLKCTGIVLYKDGEKNVTVLIVNTPYTEEKNYIASISNSVYDTAKSITDIFTEDEIKKGLNINVEEKESRNDRTYLMLNLI